VPGVVQLFSYSAQKPKPATPPEPTKDDVDKYVALWRGKGIPDCDSFQYHARWFRDWYQTAHAADISAKRRAAGAKGLTSAKRKEKPKSEDGHTASGKRDKRRGARPPHKEFQEAIAQAAGQPVEDVRDILTRDSDKS